MARKNRKGGNKVKVTREVFALAVVASHRAALRNQEDGNYLPGRVFGSRRITGRMLKALKAQAA